MQQEHKLHNRTIENLKVPEIDTHRGSLMPQAHKEGSDKMAFIV